MTDSNDFEERITALEALMAKTTEELAPILESMDSTKAEESALYEEYKNQVNAVRARRIALDRERFERQRLINEVQAELRKIEEEKRKADLERQAAEAAQKIADDYAVLDERFDRLTAGAHWREWAKDHQIAAGKFITQNRRVILADPMGLGKTLSAIISVEMAQQATKECSPTWPFLGEVKRVYDYEIGDYTNKIVDAIERPVGRRVLYLCPSSLVKNVRDEWKNWAPHRNVMFIYKMTKDERNYALEFAKENFQEYVVICNYEAWRRDSKLLNTFIEMDFDTVIIDEAHNAKEMKTSIWKGINSILTTSKPEYIIPMTGTPILNRPQELFTLLNMVAPTVYYHENDFLYSYCEQYTTDTGTVLWKFKEGGLERIAKQISKYFMRRTKDQAGIKLPPKTLIVHDLELDKESYPLQAKARQEMRQYATIVIDESKGKALSAAAVIAMYTRLRQIETWPAGIIQYAKDPMTGKILIGPDGEKEIALQLDIEESQKLDYCINQSSNGEWDGLIPEAIEDERMVLFSQFKAPLREIAHRVNASGKHAIILDGDTPESLREEIRHDFDVRYTPDRSQSKWDIVLCNYKVGGVGLNLTGATQLIVLDEEWNPGKRDQAYDRIHRIGQEKPVTVHLLRVQNTIDDWLASLMENKEATVNGFDAAVSANVDDFRRALEEGEI